MKLHQGLDAVAGDRNRTLEVLSPCSDFHEVQKLGKASKVIKLADKTKHQTILLHFGWLDYLMGDLNRLCLLFEELG